LLQQAADAAANPGRGCCCKLGCGCGYKFGRRKKLHLGEELSDGFSMTALQFQYHQNFLPAAQENARQTSFT
jgi:hypothetical protein